MKRTDKILLMLVAFCIIMSGTLCLGAYKAAKITFTISGSTGVSNVVMKGLPNNPVTDMNGNYTATLEYGWNGTVMPTKEGYIFEPDKKVYGKVVGNQTNQSYNARLITLTISGTAGTSGVIMEGLPGSPVTNAKGNYTATVDYGFNGTVTPLKEGYNFQPANKKYDPVTKNQGNQSYSAKLKTFTISGATGMDGIVMKGLPGNPVTRGGGLYTATVDYGWSDTVTPTREGYIFEPANRIYDKIAGNHSNQSYSARLITFDISGTTGQSGVVMKGLPGTPVTNEDGYYTSTVDYGFAGTVIPTKEGYNFRPANKKYDPVTNDQANQSYSAKLKTFTISGATGMDGVVMQGLPGNSVTNANGYYTAIVDYGWSSVVAPIKKGYTFNPSNRIYNPIAMDQTNQSYTSKLMTFDISGAVKDLDIMPVEGVFVSADRGGGSDVTDAQGQYTVTVDYDWSGKVKPKKEGYSFKSEENSYNSVTENQTYQHFAATLNTFTISGTANQSGVVIKGLPGDPVTDTNGYYFVTVDYGFSGTITPTKEGYTFEPANRSYAKVIGDQGNQSYDATLLTYTISGSVVIGGEPIEGVSVIADNGGSSDTTNARGQYSVTVNYGWSGMVKPAKEGYIFDPPGNEYLNVTSNINEDKRIEEAKRRVAERETAEQRAIERSLAEQYRAAVQKAAEREAVVQETTEPEVIERKVFEEPVVERNPFNKKPIVEKPVKVTELPLINNIFVDTDLRQVLQDISSQAGVTIIPDQTIEGLITCELTDVPLEKALEIVLAGTGYVINKTPDYYLVSSPNPKDAAFFASSKTNCIKLNYMNARTAVQMLSPVFKNYIQADPVLGAVCITASPSLMERIESDLELIDRPPRHVMLDARIVVMQHNDLLNLGVEWGWPKIKAGVFSTSNLHGSGTPAKGGKWPWGIEIGYTAGAEFTNSLELSLNLLERNGEATIVSSPQVLAQDGKMAEIRVTTEEYYSLTPKIAEGQASYYNRAELEKIEYGTVLNITPHIGRNNDITLDLAIEVSDVMMRTEDDYPVVTRRVVNNTMRIKNGGTVTVAGLKKSSAYSIDESTPGLSKLPIFGGLFKNKNTRETSQELAIFITAHLVSDSLVQEPTTGRKQRQPASEQLMEKDFRRELERKLSLPTQK